MLVTTDGVPILCPTLSLEEHAIPAKMLGAFQQGLSGWLVETLILMVLNMPLWICPFAFRSFVVRGKFRREILANARESGSS